MATYDLNCCACGAEFEVFSTGFLKDDQRVCPECGSTDVEQKFTGFNFGTSSSSSSSPSCGAPAGCGFT
ncbi:MAG: zinc ribbon domain-containing protein [Thermoleophilia bacterium]